LIVVFDKSFPKLVKMTAQKLKDPSFIPIPVVVGVPLLAGRPSRSSIHLAIPPAIN
jgi:hypothetical protein